ncbi:zonular occludens toxin domain-containing protein [Vitreoscilla massiliensis]|uniref:Zonular occludens toxin domain-containing protein n=1 Tax=Vitreoscilla massiliensis TaxID=1689272 RepID=A0ABY4E333_9NEIS|nr:zonular occludens toxin domain-containing protein [Vitreoscilla massiliensis]UOO89674.1 zonular occludens toxin domain-containing protein [Vitreoscilla massiliensis]
MIILITGNMGTGKTSYVIDAIANNKDQLGQMPVRIDGKEEWKYPDYNYENESDDDDETAAKASDYEWIKRPYYISHIDGLKVTKLGASRVSHETMSSAPLAELFPDGSLIVVDECHYVYPVRSSAKVVPEYVSKLTELRHQGHTLIIMTQHPANIDIYVRNLVSRHIHVARKQATTRLYEWNECMVNLSKQSLADATQRLYKPPKNAFKYYKSSSIHIKHKRRVSPVIYVLMVGILFIAYSFYHLSNRAKQDIGGIDTNPKTELDAQMASDVLPNATKQGVQGSNSVSNNNTQQAGQSLKPTDFVPTIPEKPESKPLYDGIRQPKTFEQVKGVMISKGKCTAYSQQGTVVNVSDVFCKKWAKDGLPFDPYRDPIPPVQQGHQQAQQQNNANVLSLTDSTTKDTMRPSVHLDAQ